MTARIPNFSHGTLATIGIYVTYHINKALHLNPYVAMPIAFLFVGGILYGLYLTVIKKLRRMGATIIALTVSTIALEIILLAGVNIYAETITSIIGEHAYGFQLRNEDFELFGLPGILIVLTLLVIFLILGLHYLLTQTKFGISMRATVENPELAQTMGINTEKIIAISWFLTGGFAGLAGCLLPIWIQGNVTTGTRILLSVMAASILGGIRSIYGAVIGGLIVGLTEVFGTVALSRVFGPSLASYRLLIPLIIMAVILMIAPEGITGVIDDLQSRRVAKEVEIADAYS